MNEWGQEGEGEGTYGNGHGERVYAGVGFDDFGGHEAAVGLEMCVSVKLDILAL